MPRPPKLTPAIQEAIANAVAAGVPFAKACLLANVAPNTGDEWLRRGESRDGRAPSSLYATFATTIKNAQARDEARRVARIDQAARGGLVTYEKTITYPDGRVVQERRVTPPEWTADAWHLERSQPDTWGRRDRLDLWIMVRQQAESLAAEYDLEVDAIIAEAQALAAGKGLG